MRIWKNGDPSFPISELSKAVDFTNYFPKTEARISNKDTDLASEMYQKGCSLKDIAFRFGCSKNKIRSSLSKHGLKLRSKTAQVTHQRPSQPGKQGALPYYGFCYFEGAIVKDPREFPTLLMIHRGWSQGKTIHQICQQLNQAKILSRKGKAWSWAALQNIVRRFIEKQVILSSGGHYEFR